MARVVEAVQIFKKVEDVTAAKDDPSPVYLMDELAEMARGSAESSEKIADRIAKRLQNKSPVVKFKALRLTRHLVNKGCGQFQRTMQRHANLVRDLIHFRGEPDPFKGDTPNQRVRDAAKEASESLFNTVMAQPVNSLGSRIQGFGSSAAAPPSSNNGGAAGGNGASTTGSRMVGFGSSGSSYTAPAATSSNNGAGSFAQRGVNRPLTGSYGDTSGAGAGSAGGYGGGGYTAPPVTATEVLGSEAQLVDSICTPGGLRLAPDPDDLRRFVEAAGSLDGLKLAELLRDKMDGSGSWQQLLRALYALEAVLLQGATQACGEIAVMFQSDPGPVQAAAGHTQAAIRERAGRVLKLLVGDDRPATAAPAAAAPAPVAAAAAAPAPAAPQAAVDLLGGVDLLGSPMHGVGHVSHQQHQRPVAGAGADDIFSGLAVPAGPSAAQQDPFTQPAQQPYGGMGALSGYPAPPQHHAAPGGVSRPPVNPFAAGLMQPGAASPLQQQGPYAAPQQNPQQQQQQWPMQQQAAPQQGLPAYGAPGGGSHSGGGGMVQQKAATPLGPAPVASQAAQAPAVPGANVRPPLDDMFADTSLSGNPATGRPGAGPATGAGPYGGAYGGAGVAYGGGGGGVSYGTPAGAYGAGAPQAHMSVPSSSGYASMGPAGPAQYTNPQGLAGGGGTAPPLHMQSQSIGRPAAPAHTGALGGVDLLGLGPSASGAGTGAGAWPGGSAGAYGGGAGVGRGAGGVGMGMGPYPGAPSGGLVMGMPGGLAGSGDGGGGMMVGPGGQVRYVGAGGQASPAMGSTGAMGMGNGHLPPQQQHAMAPGGQAYGGWQQQQQAYGVQQQHLLSAGVTSQQAHSEQRRGGVAFDFLNDQFK